MIYVMVDLNGIPIRIVDKGTITAGIYNVIEYVPAAPLRELVQLKDGPRDEAYRAAKDIAWQKARDVLNGQS